MLPEDIEKRWKGAREKKEELMERRSTIAICFRACRGLQANLVHLLWRLTLAGELYVLGGVGKENWVVI